MSEELGRIQKPSAEEFKVKRKLYFIPLVFSPRDPEAELTRRLDEYWEQARGQVASLEDKLGAVRKVFHELAPSGGAEGAKAIEELNKGSYRIVEAMLAKGAELQPIEDSDLLTEFMDWSRCLSVGLQNRRVLQRVYESYTEADKKRNSFIQKRIDESLKEDEVGILLMREGHQVQFPLDIEVFYVAPPALDQIKRWLRERDADMERETTAETGSP
ncbi:MAG: hypothetical protein HYX92_04390 [Chloroflexi bacterium]|nr:hypothetical protein [Chloroflexota bacterium]